MKLSLDPKCRCTLELDGQVVELGVSELSALRDCLQESTTSLSSSIPRPLLARLLAAGILAPAALPNAANGSYWKTALSSLALSPYVRFKLDFFTGSGLQLRGVEPAVAMFLAPEFLEAANRLSEEITEGLSRAAAACAVHATQFPRQRALDLTHRIARNWLRVHPEITRWMTCKDGPSGHLELAFRDDASVSTTAPAYPVVAITVSLARANSRKKSERVVVPLNVLPPLARTTDALRLRSMDQIGEAELAPLGVRRVLEAINTVGGFVEAGAGPPCFGPATDPQHALVVTHMGHASLIIDGGGQRILVDPWLFPWDEAFEKQPLLGSQLGPVDAIFFTHHHDDHLNVSSLLLLPHDVPVFVPDETGRLLEPRTAEFLRLVGFRDVRTLAHGETHLVGGGMTVESVPFFGEGQNRLGFGANCYLVSNAGRSVLLHADASPDSEGRSILGSGRLRDIVIRRGPIEVVFGTWWQQRRFVCQLSPLAVVHPNVTGSMWVDDTELSDCPPGFVRDLAQASGASHVVLYAESGPECFLHRHAMSGYVPSISFLWRGIEDFRRIINTATPADVVEAQPYLKVIIPVDGAATLDWSDVAESRVRT